MDRWWISAALPSCFQRFDSLKQYQVLTSQVTATSPSLWKYRFAANLCRRIPTGFENIWAFCWYPRSFGADHLQNRICFEVIWSSTKSNRSQAKLVGKNKIWKQKPKKKSTGYPMFLCSAHWDRRSWKKVDEEMQVSALVFCWGSYKSRTTCEKNSSANVWRNLVFVLALEKIVAAALQPRGSGSLSLIHIAWKCWKAMINKRQILSDVYNPLWKILVKTDHFPS